MNRASISILGLGYVGMVQIVGLAKSGLKVIGNDKNPRKIKSLRDKKSTIIEPGVQSALEEFADRIRVVDTLEEILHETDVTFICVGTPPSLDGSANLDMLFGVAEEAGRALRTKGQYHTFVIRSTVPMGTSREFIKMIERHSDKRFAVDFGVVMQPEFLREGTGLEDFLAPPFTILGTDNEKDAEELKKIYQSIGITENIFKVSFEEAEFFKYLNNNFHALKVSFANEVAQIGKKLGLEPIKLMKIFVLDKKLNLSPYYLIPGMPFGGYCLPKDTLGLRSFLRKKNIKVETISSVVESNANHFSFIFDTLIEILDGEKSGTEKVGILGVAFKKDIDDVRESPFVRVFQFLSSRGFKMKFYDSCIHKESFLGANLSYIQGLFRNFFDYQVVDMREFIAGSDVIIIGCGNGIEDMASHRELLRGKKIICMDPKFYGVLDQYRIDYDRVI